MAHTFKVWTPEALPPAPKLKIPLRKIAWFNLMRHLTAKPEAPTQDLKRMATWYGLGKRWDS
jgi:hypothetical protein